MELLKEFYSLYTKITSNKPYTIEELFKMFTMRSVLNSLEYKDISLYTIDRKYIDEIKNYSKELTGEYNNLCDEYFFNINKKFLNILRENLTIDIPFEYKGIITKEEMFKEIESFYRTMGIEEYILVNKMLNSKRIFLKNEPLAKADGYICSFDNEHYIFVTYPKELLGADVTTVLAHELGHPLGKKRTISNIDININPFRETIPIILEMTYSRTRENNIIEYAKQRYDTLSILMHYCFEIYVEDDMNANNAYQYTLGKSIGLYLSQLFIKDKKKFCYLYNEIKKYIYTKEETKIFDLLLQEQEFKKGDFLKKEIEETQKILIK